MIIHHHPCRIHAPATALASLLTFCKRLLIIIELRSDAEQITLPEKRISSGGLSESAALRYLWLKNVWYMVSIASRCRHGWKKLKSPLCCVRCPTLFHNCIYIAFTLTNAPLNSVSRTTNRTNILSAKFRALAFFLSKRGSLQSRYWLQARIGKIF